MTLTLGCAEKGGEVMVICILQDIMLGTRDASDSLLSHRR